MSMQLKTAEHRRTKEDLLERCKLCVRVLSYAYIHARRRATTDAIRTVQFTVNEQTSVENKRTDMTA